MEIDGTVDLAVAGETVYGLIVEEAALGGNATIQTHGIAKGIAAGAHNAGIALASDANGKLVAAATGDYVVGYSRDVGAADEVISVLLTPGGQIN